MNWNIQNSMVVLTVSALDWKYPFWANLILKNQNSTFKGIVNSFSCDN